MYKANSNHVVVEFEKGDDMVMKGDLVDMDGIYIPDQSSENGKLIHAEITSVGPKCVLGFEVGQTVLYDKYAINKFNSDFGNFGVLSEDNIILIEK